MASKTSVVTPERFATGMATFKEWMEAIPERADEFQGHYDDYVPDPDDIAAIKKMVDERSVKALVLGEHWCPDVWRGLPVISHVSEQTGMELRMFFRDQNNDIMAEFLNQGEFESIPTIVFYDGDLNYLGHWIERPKLAQDEMREIRSRVMPDGPPPEDSPQRAEVMARYAAEREQAAPNWRHAQVAEIRELLETALS